jgi:hypothetical protein
MELAMKSGMKTTPKRQGQGNDGTKERPPKKNRNGWSELADRKVSRAVMSSAQKKS